MTIKEISLEKQVELLENHSKTGGGRIFHVDFIKRTTGEFRSMFCRFDVKFDLKGGPDAYNPKEKNLLWVFDIQAMKRKSINLDMVVGSKIDGQEYKVI